MNRRANCLLFGFALLLVATDAMAQTQRVMLRVRDRFSEDVCNFASREIQKFISLGANMSQIECVFSNQTLKNLQQEEQYQLGFDFAPRESGMRELDYTFKRADDVWAFRDMLAKPAPDAALAPFAQVFTAVMLTFVWNVETPCRPGTTSARARDVRARVAQLLAAWDQRRDLWDESARDTAAKIKSKLEPRLEHRVKLCERAG